MTPERPSLAPIHSANVFEETVESLLALGVLAPGDRLPSERDLAQAQVRLSELLAATPRIEEVIRHSEAQHGEIVEAIKRGDADAARQAMHEHISGTASFLRGFLQ